MSSVVPRAVFVPILLAVLGIDAGAGTITVSKTGALKTIQSGVNAAGPGDTVIVKAGTYRENVTIPTGKDNLELDAKDGVVIDALPTGGAPAGPGIVVDSPGVTISGFEIRNAQVDTGPYPACGILGLKSQLLVKNCRICSCRGQAVFALPADGDKVKDSTIENNDAGLELTGSGVQISNVVIHRAPEKAIRIVGDGAQVKRCDVRGIEGLGVDIFGDDALVEDNEFESIHNGAIEVNGASALVQNNVLTNVANNGIWVTGDGPEVVKNTVNGCALAGIGVFGGGGSGGKVKKNVVTHCERGGIVVVAPDVDVTKNVISFIDGEALSVSSVGGLVQSNEIRDVIDGIGMSLEGDALEVRDNEVKDVNGGHVGIQIGGAIGATIAGNDVARTSSHGYFVATGCSDCVIEDNSATDCGNGFEHGFRIEGPNHMVRANSAKRCYGDGFNVQSADHVVLDGNTSEENGQDGIDVSSGVGIVVKNNTVKSNHAEGIENSAPGATVTNNVSKKNRTDYADDSGGASYSGNVSSDGTDAAPAAPEID